MRNIPQHFDEEDQAVELKSQCEINHLAKNSYFSPLEEKYKFLQEI